MGTPVMSALVIARINTLGGEPGAVLSGITTAIAANGALCALAALAIAVFLRSARQEGANA